MQLIFISRGTFAGGKQLAESLAKKLDYDCLDRETVCDRATDAGIPVGKLEMAVLRRRPLNERLSLERDRFKAFFTATLCERLRQGEGLVYHGRTGHLPLPGVDHALRVRAIMDPEMRAALTMQRLGLTREKAYAYNEQVDEDRQRWARILYNVDWQDPAHYDVVLNLSHVRFENAAAGLVSLAQLPEFQITPANERMLAELELGARCRLALADDPRTRGVNVQIKAERSRVLATYLPRQSDAAAHIPEVLQQIDGVGEIVCTMASTNVLWIQERFEPSNPAIDDIIDVARRWGAAIEMVQLSEGEKEETAANAEAEEAKEAGEAELGHALADREKHGGILDDSSPAEELDHDEQVKQTVGRLVSEGKAGGFRAVKGGPKQLINSIDRTTPYSLVVVGDVFLSKAEAVRKRQSRELASYLGESLRVPVVAANELKTQYRFGARQWLSMILFGAATAVIFGLVYVNQLAVLELLTAEGTANRILATVAVVILVPVFAYCYGTFTGRLLRLFKFE